MRPTTQKLYLTIARAYFEAVQHGFDRLHIHIEVVADILDHLDARNDVFQRTIVPLDDLSDDALLTLLGINDEIKPKSVTENAG